MAISYDDWKKQYEAMTTDQQKSYANMVKWNATATEYANRYIQEKQNAGTFWTQAVKSSTPTSTQTNTQQNTTTTQNQTNNNGSNWYSNTQTTTSNQWGSSLSDWKNGDWNTYWKFTFDVNEFLDESKFWTGTGVKVQEWTAKDTGRPDYQIESDARLNEMVNNLNTYRQTNPEFFSSREEFNKQFEYNQRQSDAQRALLDSYWKKAQDFKKASQYTTWDSFNAALNNWTVTEGQLDALKQYNPEVFMQWQQKLIDEQNLAIANLADKFDIDTMTSALERIVQKLNIEPWDPYDIIGGWEDMMQRTWAWDSLKEMDTHAKNASEAARNMQRITNNYASSTGWNQSDTLVAARLQKALAPYQQLYSDEYNLYQMSRTSYQTKMWTASEYAQTIQMQAQEDQRIFNNKIKALWFAMDVYSYRTPEQQAQLKLRTQQIQNNMDLFQQAQESELERFNYVADTNLQNQMNASLTDLSITDPAQLRANLNNVLDEYYSQYWDIIKRSKSEVIDDVLAQAKAEWISVAQALRKNFIEPLQSKPEYKNMIRSNYWLGSEVQKIWDTLVWITYDDNWIPQVHYLGNYWDKTVSVWTISNNFTWYNPVASATVSSWLNNFISSHSVGETWGQCWSFVNDYLQSLWLDRLFVDPIDKKKAVKNSDTPTVWSVAIMDSKTSPQYWHVAIVKSVNSDWTVSVIESNWWGDQLVHERNIKTSDIYWYFDPSKAVSWYSSDPNWNNNWYFESLEPDYKAYFESWKPALTDSKWKSLLETYWITEKEFREQAANFAKTGLKQSWASEAANALESAYNLREYVDWSKALFWDTLQSWWADRIMSYIPWTSQYDAKAEYDTLISRMSLKALFEAKANGATFWSMSDSEWKILWDAATNLRWWTSWAKFKSNLDSLISALEKAVIEWNWTMPSNYTGDYTWPSDFNPVQINMPSYTTQWNTLWSTLTWWYTNWTDMFNQG